MATDKELADALRLVADAYPGSSFSAEGMQVQADELDPPAPTYAEGTIAWVTTLSGGRRWLAERRHGGWVLGGRDHGYSIRDVSVTDVTPVRTLADDEIALPRAAFDSMPSVSARSYARTLRSSRMFTAARLFDAYADALDAESGARS